MDIKPKLIINKAELSNWSRTLGMDYTLGSIANSNLFEVSYHNETVNAMRGYRSTIVYLEGNKILLDFWEYATPCYTNEVVNGGFDLVIKLQAKKITFDQLQNYCNRKNLLSGISNEQRLSFFEKIVPFNFFPSRMFFQYIGKESELPSSQNERFGFFCGKSWKCRNPITKYLSDNNIDVIFSKQGEVDGKSLTDEEYMQKMSSSKFGIVLAGRSTMITDAKNRREIDYMMLKKPLLINYKPFYYNELIEGKHYIFFDEKTDLNKLESIYNLKEVADNAFQWYLDNATPSGIANTFLKIATDRKFV